MARWYGSFMLRCWRLPGGGERVDIEHMQSGGRTRVTSLAAAVTWIEAHCGQPTAESDPADADRAVQADLVQGQGAAAATEGARAGQR
jgi:hypothetical protein